MRSRLTALLVVSALACIIGELAGLRGLVYIAKPAATIAVLLLAIAGPSSVSRGYQGLIASGLVLSLAGDVFLMLPGDWFIPGLASFLVAHLCYIAAFVGAGGGLRSPVVALGVGGVGTAMLVLLWPALGAVRVPVVLYVGVIATMAWQAIARWRHLVTGAIDDGAASGAASGAALAAAGAMLFMVSDSTLAVRRFIGDFSGGVVVVLGTYWTAQYLIAQSVRR